MSAAEQIPLGSATTVLWVVRSRCRPARSTRVRWAGRRRHRRLPMRCGCADDRAPGCRMAMTAQSWQSSTRSPSRGRAGADLAAPRPQAQGLKQSLHRSRSRAIRFLCRDEAPASADDDRRTWEAATVPKRWRSRRAMPPHLTAAAALIPTTKEYARLRYVRRLTFWSAGAYRAAIRRSRHCPVPAIRSLLASTGTQVSDYDLFDVQSVCAAVLPWPGAGLPLDRTNVNGGAIALGHPLERQAHHCEPASRAASSGGKRAIGLGLHRRRTRHRGRNREHLKRGQSHPARCIVTSSTTGTLTTRTRPVAAVCAVR